MGDTGARLSLPISMQAYPEKRRGTVCSSLPSATGSPFTSSLVFPPVATFGASAMNSNRAFTGPVGSLSGEEIVQPFAMPFRSAFVAPMLEQFDEPRMLLTFRAGNA